VEKFISSCASIYDTPSKQKKTPSKAQVYFRNMFKVAFIRTIRLVAVVIDGHQTSVCRVRMLLSGVNIWELLVTRSNMSQCPLASSVSKS
jgi:hypothetical protein